LPDGWILLNQTGQEEPAYKNNRDKKSETDYHSRQTIQEWEEKGLHRQVRDISKFCSSLFFFKG